MGDFERLTGEERRAARRLRWFLVTLAALAIAVAIAAALFA